MSIKRYNYKTGLNWTSNDTSVSEQKLFLDATYSLLERTKRIKVRYLLADENGFYSENINPTDYDWKRLWFTEQRHRSLGRCYSFDLDESRLKRGIYYLRLEL